MTLPEEHVIEFLAGARIDDDSPSDRSIRVEALPVLVQGEIRPNAFEFRELRGDRTGIALLSPGSWSGDATDLMLGEEVSIDGDETDRGVTVNNLRRTGTLLEERVHRREGDSLWTRSGQVRITPMTVPREFFSRDSGRRYQALPAQEIGDKDAVMMLTRLDGDLDCLVAVAIGVERADDQAEIGASR